MNNGLDKTKETWDDIIYAAMIDLNIRDKELGLLQSKICELEASNKMLKRIINAQSVKVNFYKSVTGSSKAIPLPDIIKVINCGIELESVLQLLRDNKVLDETNLPNPEFVDRGYFRIIESKFSLPDGTVRISMLTVVFPKGIDFIRRMVARNQNE